MSLRLPHHLRYGLAGSTRIFLDLRTGLYFHLEPNEDEIFEALEQGAFVNPGKSRPLLDAGLLAAGGDGQKIRPTANPEPLASLVEEGGIRRQASLAWIGSTTLALIKSRFSVRRPAALLAPRSRAPIDEHCPPERLKSLVGSFLAARRFVPLPPNCLRDSIALHHILARHGIAARLVVGAKLHPFAAHCWVQRDRTILNDCLAGATGFAPILVIE